MRAESSPAGRNASSARHLHSPGREVMAQLMWYIAQTRDTGKIKKLVEAYYVMNQGGWVGKNGPIYPNEPFIQMRRQVQDWAGLELLDSDGPFWIPVSGDYTSPLVHWVVSLCPPKWRKGGIHEAPPGIDRELWRDRLFVLDEVKQWRDGYLEAKAKKGSR